MSEAFKATDANQADIDNRFAFHPATDNEKQNRHSSARGACWQAACEIDNLCPESREKSLAFTKLEEAMMWANAAIARQS